MKHFLFALLIFPNVLLANEELEKRMYVQIYRDSTKFDATLTKNESVYEFQFETYGREHQTTISYSIDGITKTGTLDKNTLSVRSTPGKHIFQFFYSDQFYEVYSDSLMIKGQHRDYYKVYLERADIQQMTEKPVIYLYPETTTNVQVKIDIHGNDIFTYPLYNDGWNFTAEPNGDLIFGENTYNYLFWEAITPAVLSPKQTASGFFVKGKNAIEFLEEKLKLAGLNSKEQADFITYWGPRLAKNTLNFVHFEFNDECNTYADLDISPKPDNIYRIYMTWGAVQAEFPTADQEFPSMDRTGFSVLEWGGQEVHIRNNFTNRSN